MGSKKTLPIYYPFNAQAISSTNTYTSPVTQVANLDNIGPIVAFTGTPTGTLSVQGSNDGASFVSLSFNPVLTQPTGSSLSYGINLNQFPWPYLRFQYVNSSGSGTLTISIFGKDLN